MLSPPKAQVLGPKVKSNIILTPNRRKSLQKESISPSNWENDDAAEKQANREREKEARRASIGELRRAHWSLDWYAARMMSSLRPHSGLPTVAAASRRSTTSSFRSCTKTASSSQQRGCAAANAAPLSTACVAH
jgi:hypothetical protein